MRFVEFLNITEAYLHHSYWYKPETDETVRVPSEIGKHHIDSIMENPGLFGITTEMLLDLPDYGKENWKSLERQAKARGTWLDILGHNGAVFNKTAVRNGWVRLTATDRKFGFVQSRDLPEARDGLRFLIERLPDLKEVDLQVGKQGMSLDEPGARWFARTGKLPPVREEWFTGVSFNASMYQQRRAVKEEYITRAKDDYGNSSEVFKNSSQAEFRKLLREYGELRAFIDLASDDLYVWNSSSPVLHGHVMNHLNLGSDIYLSLQQDAPILLYSNDLPEERKPAVADTILSNPYLQRLYGFSGFHDVETDEWVADPREFLAEMEAGKEIDFQYDVTGHHHGQDDGNVIAYNPQTRDIYGYLDWTSFENETHIRMIEVKPEYQRQGIARMMIEFLKKKNEEPINWGFTTPEGTEFRKAIGDDDETR